MKEFNFYTHGQGADLVEVQVETLKDGRTLVYASAERLSQRAFGQMLKTEFPGVRFMVEYGRQEYKAVSLSGGKAHR